MNYILVVEDDEFYRKIYETKLTEAGFLVKVFPDGASALPELESNPPTLAVLDLIMPKMDGFSLLNQIKSHPNLSKIPVIVMSNLNQEKDINEAKRLGAIDYLVKTEISLSDAIEAITKHYQAIVGGLKI